MKKKYIKPEIDVIKMNCNSNFLQASKVDDGHSGTGDIKNDDSDDMWAGAKYNISLWHEE